MWQDVNQKDKIDAMLEMYVDKSYMAVKRKRDSSAPSAARNGYQIFCEDARPRVKKENPEKKMTQLSTLLGNEWKALTEEQKKPYQERAEADKLRYAEEMNAYDARIFQLESSSYAGSGSQNASQPASVVTA